MTKEYITGGRKKGTPNRVTGTVKEMISKSISAELESLQISLDQVDTKRRIINPSTAVSKKDKDNLKKGCLSTYQYRTIFTGNYVNI